MQSAAREKPPSPSPIFPRLAGEEPEEPALDPDPTPAPSPARPPSSSGIIGGLMGGNVGGVAGGVVGGQVGGQVGASIGGAIGSAAQNAIFSQSDPSSLDISSYRPAGGAGVGSSGGGGGGDDEVVRLLRVMARGITSMASEGVKAITRPQGISGPGGKV